MLTLTITLGSFTGVFGQNQQTKVSQNYENHQRALRLILLRNEVKLLDDAPMRCFARVQIVRFIFDNAVTREYDAANSIALDCLEDIRSNSSQFSESQRSFWKSTILLLLRQKSPEIVSKIEEKYFAEDDLSFSDLQEIDRSTNLAAITDRTISKILKGDVSGYLFPIFAKIREKSQQAGIRILEALLSFLEKTPNLDSHATTLDFFSTYYLEESAPAELTKRFLNFSVRLGGSQLTQTEVSELYRLSHDILKLSIPKIAIMIPSLHQQAMAIYAVLDGKLAKINRERDEVRERIELSDDKLRQTILEAEATENKALESDLWLSAAHLAVQQRKFRLAVDSILKFRLDVESAKSYRDYFLLNNILPASLKVSDFEASNYLIARVDDRNERGGGIFKIVSRHVELNDLSQAYSQLEDGLKVFDKAENSPAKIRILLSGVPIAFNIEKPKAYEIASLAIKTANRIPTPDLDDKLGTSSRIKYVDSVLIPTSFNIVNAFKILAKNDVGFATATAQEIESKSWRLAVEIVIETERKYLLPEHLQIKAPKTNR